MLMNIPKTVALLAMTANAAAEVWRLNGTLTYDTLHRLT